jgi:hypothetical protein
MADEKRTTPSSGDGGRRRRSAPTIDLTATEVGVATGAAAPEPPHAGPESSDTPTRESLSAAEAGRETGGTAGRFHAAVKTSHLVAGVAGGGLVALVLFAVWLTGLVPIRYAGQTGLSARVAGLETQLQDLASKPAVGAATKAVDEMNERIGKVEQSLAKIPTGDPGAAERLAAVENASQAMGIALAALNHRADDLAAGTAAAAKAGTDTGTLQKRIDALESAAKATQDKVAQSTNADNAARLALAAVALRDAAARGEPYGSQLGAVRSLGADAKLLTPLEPFAASGAPSEAALARELAALQPAMLEASGANAAASGSFIDRLQANAGKLVRVRPADEPVGDDASTVLARIELKTARQDISGAQADIAKLPAKARNLAEAWSKKAEARKAALAAGDALVADATRMLGKSAGSP